MMTKAQRAGANRSDSAILSLPVTGMRKRALDLSNLKYCRCDRTLCGGRARPAMGPVAMRHGY
jgi:hypothetical protein